MKNFKIIIIVSVFILGFGSVLLYVANKDQSKDKEIPETQNTINETHSIVLTEQGFKPRNITIKLGDTIEFSTDRDRPHWPASNLHPSHMIYSAFDPKEPIPQDKTWSFTFTRLGKWGLHDHLQGHFTGTIEVIE